MKPKLNVTEIGSLLVKIYNRIAVDWKKATVGRGSSVSKNKKKTVLPGTV